MTTYNQSTGAFQPVDTEDVSAKQRAADAAQVGKDAAGDVATTATNAAKDVAQQTSVQARDLLGKTKTQVSEQVGTQQSAVVENLRSLGDQLAEMTDHVEHRGTAVDLATQARDRVRGAADWLDGRDPGEVLDELRKFGRNKPGAFLLGSAVAGVVAGRLTRGVVAVHTNDSDSDSSRSRPAISGYGPPDARPTEPQPSFGGPEGYGGTVQR
jgi:hypothetical protein